MTISVLSDVMSMPEMDGFEVAKLIHRHPRFEKTPIIFVSGVNVSELDRLRGYQVGAVDYVSIPLVPEILRGKVAVLVELYCKRRELQALNRTLAFTNAQLEQANLTLQADKTRELERLNQGLQEANAGLETANRHKDEFLAMLAHELRNPLAAIHNAFHFMRRKSGGEAQLTRSQDIIERQLAQLTRLVDDLLDISRITRGKITLAKEVVDLAALVTRAVETAQPLIEERRHELSVQLPAEKLTVLGDPVRLTQALANVLSNAAKYTDCGGCIWVSAAHDCASEIEVRVRDTGIGIPPELLPMVFEPFTQLECTSGRTQGGLGIGLALVRNLIEMHDGRVSAHSDGPGRGSEFVLHLPRFTGEARTSGEPLFDSPAPPVLQRSGGSAETSPPARRRILLADDNGDVLESLALLLEVQGHEVYTAANGALALEHARQHHPDMALLDIGMPVMDGYEVARRIRAQPWGARILLVAVTGWGQDADRRRSDEAGFDSHLVKPLDLGQLAQLLVTLPTTKPSGPTSL
jgi:signal transduction histidine kinase/ActR/RegA family two-component response regulator